jgi:prepilin-type N-terminal cleavage/methylation domain-containing protein
MGQRRQSGMTLIELLIAMSIGAVGLLAVMSLFIAAIANNNRSKRDTTGVLLSQSVLEQALLAGTNGTATISLTDCLNNTYTINTAGAASPGAGASLDSNGNIDFSGAAPGSNYSMQYTVCRANGQTAVYDVRWNVMDMETQGPNVYTRLIRVAAKPNGTIATGAILSPITLRGVAAVAEN